MVKTSMQETSKLAGLPKPAPTGGTRALAGPTISLHTGAARPVNSCMWQPVAKFWVPK